MGEAVSYELSYELIDGVAVLRLDDGKANALSPSVLGELESALDRAEKEAKAVLIVGRPGRFSAGFDLAVMRTGLDAMRSLVTAGAEFLVRVHMHPRPVVVACTGHALAAGALILLAADLRLGARGDFKIGLNEVAIGMALPIFAVELARERVSKRHLSRATTQAEIYGPEAAADAGFLDRVTEPDTLVAEALAEARRLGELADPAFRLTRERVRGATVAHIRATLEADMQSFGAPS